MIITLIRIVDDRKRYYQFELFRNLFDEWLLIRTYGAIRNLKPTRSIEEVFMSQSEAMGHLKYLLEQKRLKGYCDLDLT